MNAKTKWIAVAVLLAVLVGAWQGRALWRARHGLVTLQVRNAPLADVVKSIERQTRRNIIYDTNLQGKITLNLVDAPLSAALDAVAFKAGARWQEVDAVGASALAWRQLEMALRAGGDVANAGWTNLAPRFDDLPPPGAAEKDDDHPDVPPGAMLRHIGGGPISEGRGAGGGMRMITMTGDGRVDQWSSERLVLEISLALHLGTVPTEASFDNALQTAAVVHGEARIYYALEKSLLGGMGLGTGPRLGPRRLLRQGPGGPPSEGGPPPGDIGAAIISEQRQARLRELGNSPEEQVEQARQRAAGGGQVRVENFKIN